MDNPVLKRLIEKSDFSNIKFKDIDFTEEQDEILEILMSKQRTIYNIINLNLNPIYKEDNKEKPIELIITNYKEKLYKSDVDRIPVPILPLTARKRFLYEQSLLKT